MPDLTVILLVEDRQDDVFLIRTALEKGRVFNPIQAVQDGEEAIAYLTGEGKFGNREEFPLPGLILLDLKMPRMDGFELLKWIRQQPGLQALRVIVLTSSDHIPDVNLAYQLGANSFLLNRLILSNSSRRARLSGITGFAPIKRRKPSGPRKKSLQALVLG